VRLRLALLVVLLLAAPGCGGGDGVEPQEPRADAAVGIEEAQRLGGVQRVHGTLIAQGGEARLCSAILESFPPQCGEPSLRVEGADVDSMPQTTTAQGVTWSNREITLRGEVDGGVLRLSGG
jgi:hypothetical protein